MKSLRTTFDEVGFRWLVHTEVALNQTETLRVQNLLLNKYKRYLANEGNSEKRRLFQLGIEAALQGRIESVLVTNGHYGTGNLYWVKKPDQPVFLGI